MIPTIRERAQLLYGSRQGVGPAEPAPQPRQHQPTSKMLELGRGMRSYLQLVALPHELPAAVAMVQGRDSGPEFARHISMVRRARPFYDHLLTQLIGEVPGGIPSLKAHARRTVALAGYGPSRPLSVDQLAAVEWGVKAGIAAALHDHYLGRTAP